jgi:broad specificity phosphatase PhoE
VLYLVRHGRTRYNAERRLLGRLDVDLDELGRRQAHALGQVGFLHDASRVVSSPLARAVDTAKALGPPVTIDPGWTEIDYGIYDGLPLQDTDNLWQEWGHNLAYTPEAGESIARMGERVRQACIAIWEEATSSDVVIVSHVSPIKAAVAWVLGAGDEICWRMFLEVASVSKVGVGRDGPSLHTFNETHYRPSA